MINVPDEKQDDEIKRVMAAAEDMARLMNGRFVLEQAKLQAFVPSRDKSRLERERDIELS